MKVEFRETQFSRVRMALSATPVAYIEDDIRKKLTWSVLYNKLKDQYNNYSVLLEESISRKIR